MVKITSKRHNFRRCGMAHPKGETVYQDGRFTKKEIEILKAEPMLKLEHVEDSDSLPKDLLSAAITSIDNGNVTKEGKPEVKAIEEILGRDITAGERDRAYEEINNG